MDQSVVCANLVVVTDDASVVLILNQAAVLCVYPVNCRGKLGCR